MEDAVLNRTGGYTAVRHGRLAASSQNWEPPLIPSPLTLFLRSVDTFYHTFWSSPPATWHRVRQRGNARGGTCFAMAPLLKDGLLTRRSSGDAYARCKQQTAVTLCLNALPAFRLPALYHYQLLCGRARNLPLEFCLLNTIDSPLLLHLGHVRVGRLIHWLGIQQQTWTETHRGRVRLGWTGRGGSHFCQRLLYATFLSFVVCGQAVFDTRRYTTTDVNNFTTTCTYAVRSPFVSRTLLTA